MKKKFKILNACLLFALLQSQLFAFTTKNDKIFDSIGKEVNFKGINWFGFNNGATMVDGIWSGSGSIASDFATVVHRIQLLGFNAVRLPFSFKDLYNLTPRNYVLNLNPPSLSTIQANVTNPSVPVSGTIPALVYQPTRTPGKINDYLPNDSVLNRFIWVVNFFARNGFYVLIDNHFEDQTAVENRSLWVQRWKELVTKISQDPISKKMLMIDILNEPDSYGLSWETLKDMYLSVMDAVYPVNPEALIFVEGTAQGDIGANWGDGFATDQTNISNPRSFFDTVLTKPYVNQVVISPHVYPPSVTGASSNFTGTGLWNRMSKSFGYLTKTGYKNEIFPVAIGEFGSRFATANDVNSMKDMAIYFNNTGSAADGKHNPIGNWFYWSWNPNSSDTGGIVTDNWVNVNWTKIDYLTTIGLKPWYLNNTPAKNGTVSLTVAPVSGLTAADLKPFTVGSQTFTVTSFNTPISKTLPVGTYTITPPAITKSGTQYVADPVTITVTDGGTASAQITYKVVPVTTGTLSISVAPVSGLTASDLKSITVGSQTFSFTGFNAPVSKTLPAGNYTVTAPAITKSGVQYVADPIAVRVTAGGTVSAQVTYKVVPVATGMLSLKVAAVSGLDESDLKPITIGGKAFTVVDFDEAVAQSLPTGTYTVSAPTITKAGVEYKADSQSVTILNGVTSNVTITYKSTPVPSGDFSVDVRLGSVWQEDPSSDIYFSDVNFTVRNNGSTTVSVPWTFSVTNGDFQAVTSSWNVNIDSVNNGTITGTVTEDWQTLTPNGGNPGTFGLIIRSDSPNFAPSSVKINGKAATVTISR